MWASSGRCPGVKSLLYSNKRGISRSQGSSRRPSGFGRSGYPDKGFPNIRINIVFHRIKYICSHTMSYRFPASLSQAAFLQGSKHSLLCCSRAVLFDSIKRVPPMEIGWDCVYLFSGCVLPWELLSTLTLFWQFISAFQYCNPLSGFFLLCSVEIQMQENWYLEIQDFLWWDYSLINAFHSIFTSPWQPPIERGVCVCVCVCVYCIQTKDETKYKDE